MYGARLAQKIYPNLSNVGLSHEAEFADLPPRTFFCSSRARSRSAVASRRAESVISVAKRWQRFERGGAE